MKIVLVGYMASGKSLIGQLLAKDLNLEFIDLDDQIELESEMAIPQIFEEKGEIFFRKKEYEVLNQILKNKDNLVLATGGGTPCYGNNMQTIGDFSDVSIYLQLSIPSLKARIEKEKQHRPLVRDVADEDLPEFIGKHLFERRPFYGRATKTLVCDQKSAEEIVAEIKSMLL